MSRGQPRKSMAYQGSIGLTRHRLSSGGAVRRSSLRCAPFGPPTVSCVLAPARTCLRQAPPTFRGRGLATSAVPHHLTDDMAMKTFTTGKRCKKTSFFSPFQKIQTNGVKSGRFLHRLVRSCGCLGQASGQVLHGHLHDTDRIALKISHLDRWQYSKRFRQHGHRERLFSIVQAFPELSLLSGRRHIGFYNSLIHR